ncbi:MAG: CAF17-like 4Fe-4S cluster assembly/insertion protein YgfZ [Burkholderiaceae bacterium]
MNAWLQFVGSHDAAHRLPSSGTGFIAPLTDMGVIAITGDDAAAFLHNQLTNDVEHLGRDEARLAGYCSPKGRLLATLLLWRDGDAIRVALPRPLVEPIRKRLSMFVLRAKAKLTDASDECALIGIACPKAGDALSPHFGALPDAPLRMVVSDAGTLIRLHDAPSGPRYLLAAPPDAGIAAWKALSQALPAADEAAWRLTEIHAGIPQVTAATQEQFVPQMVNYELIGGVNFRKGCYPGQEIVARSQYLGKLKRRMLPASVDAAATAGQEVFSEADAGQPCGMVVNAEQTGPGCSDCLVELKLAAVEAGAIRLGAADGPALRFLSLPYPLVEPQ